MLHYFEKKLYCFDSLISTRKPMRNLEIHLEFVKQEIYHNTKYTRFE